MLSGLEIKNRLDDGIVISPFNEAQLNPNSYNLRLHNKLLVYREQKLDMKKNNQTDEIEIPEEGLMLYPGKLYLGRTVEYTETSVGAKPNSDGKIYVPIISGRSSIGRLGINVHATAGFGDVSFKGFWTLEIYVVQPVIIYPNVEICQIYYEEIQGDAVPYNGKYQGQSKTISSNMFKEL